MRQQLLPLLLVATLLLSLTTLGTGSNINFESRNGRIYANGREFIFKGINWFGFETEANAPHGLWSGGTRLDAVFDFLKKQRFNALRFPFNIQSVNRDPKVSSNYLGSENGWLRGKRYLELMDAVFSEAAKRNLLVVLDYQMLYPNKGIPDLWNDGQSSAGNKVKDAWRKLAKRFCSHWNVVAADIKNEPHGSAEWGSGSSKDWVRGAQELGNHVLKYCSRWLIFVEGVDGHVKNSASYRKGYTGFWGGRLDGVKSHQVRLNNDNRLVYSPHVYGPSVFKMNYFNDRKFPHNLEWDVWEKDFGKVPNWTGRGLVIGEWGGTYEGKDREWQKAMMKYIKKKGFGAFYWCVNPNSKDTKGIFKDDWKSPNWDKIKFLASQPVTDLSSVHSG